VFVARWDNRESWDLAPVAAVAAAAGDLPPDAARLFVIKHRAEIAHVEAAFKEVKLNPLAHFEFRSRLL
jgi:hypothetical protein